MSGDYCETFDVGQYTVQENGIVRLEDGTIVGRLDDIAKADAWKETAEQSQRNTDFYRSLIDQIGELFGEAARTSDDGSVQDDVLALKVPDLVRETIAKSAAEIERRSWVSVSEREPADPCGTFVATRSPGQIGPSDVFPATWDPDINEWVTAEADIVQYVTHWMPPPDAPLMTGDSDDG